MKKLGGSLHRPLCEACLAVAMAFVLLFVTGAEFWHTDSPGTSTTCAICHFAHLPVTTGPARHLLRKYDVFSRMIVARAQVNHAEPSVLISLPRAPPA